MGNRCGGQRREMMEARAAAMRRRCSSSPGAPPAAVSVEKKTDDQGDKKVKFTMDIPGVRMQDLKIQVENTNELVVSGKRNGNEFTRRIPLSESILTDTLRANLSLGVLVISANEKPTPAPIVIDVTTSTEESAAAEETSDNSENAEEVVAPAEEEEETV